MLALFGVVLPLAGFAWLAHQVLASQALAFDIALLQHAHALHAPWLDAAMLLISALGYAWGVIPTDIGLLGVLAVRRKLREGAFAGLAIIGSALINMGAKRLIARERPALWQSIAPEPTFSFPSGHAMGSMTLMLVLILLSWPTRWRWPVLFSGAVFAVLVGYSRVYLGVHYPSDILAGWAAASAWVVACYLLVFSRGRRPWQP